MSSPFESLEIIRFVVPYDCYKFLNLVLNSITEQIVVIDHTGEIQFVNQSWSEFGNNNGCLLGDDWSGINYIEECNKAAAMGDDFGKHAGAGIKKVIENTDSTFYFEYPCHSPDEKRWFMMRVSPFEISDKHYFVISHQNITERKLAEEAMKNLARIDGLTNIPNRRTFDLFLHEEWRRCTRLKKSICLAIVDLDHFKLLNDNYGHQAGDECLIKVGELLKRVVNRPSDICARYGGEEFAITWGDTTLKQARLWSNKLISEIAQLNIKNEESPVKKYLTASIGLVELTPTRGSKEAELVVKADQMLYKAKDNGRNRVES